MKKTIYTSYLLSLSLVIWPIVSYFFPSLTNQNLYNIFFISSLSISIYALFMSNSFTEQVSSCWLILSLILFYFIRESLILLVYLSIIFFNIQVTSNIIINGLLISHIPPFILLFIMIANGMYKLKKHMIVSTVLARYLKRLLTRQNVNNRNKLASKKDSYMNEFDLTIEP